MLLQGAICSWPCMVLGVAGAEFLVSLELLLQTCRSKLLDPQPPPIRRATSQRNNRAHRCPKNFHLQPLDDPVIKGRKLYLCKVHAELRRPELCGDLAIEIRYCKPGRAARVVPRMRRPPPWRSQRLPSQISLDARSAQARACWRRTFISRRP